MATIIAASLSPRRAQDLPAARLFITATTIDKLTLVATQLHNRRGSHPAWADI
jgi:hypothetical protein